MANYSVSKLKFANDSANTYEVVDSTAVHDNIIALTSATISSIPVASGVVFTYTVAANDVLTFAAPPAGRATAFELWLTMPDPAVTFTFGSTITWEGGSVPTFAAGTTTRLKFEYVENAWHGAVTPDMSEYAKLGADNEWTAVNVFTKRLSLGRINATGNHGYLSGDNYGSTPTNLGSYGAIAIGRNCSWTFTGENLLSMGRGHNVYIPSWQPGKNLGCTILGQWGSLTAGMTFVVGNGTGGSDRRNAITVYADGNTNVQGALTSSGDIYSTLTATSGVITVPALTGEYYVCTVAQDDTITFASTTSGYVTKFSFDITVPETSEGSGTPVTFSFSDTITWEGGSMPTFGVGTHKLKFECVNGVWYGSYRPDMSEYLKAAQDFAGVDMKSNIAEIKYSANGNDLFIKGYSMTVRGFALKFETSTNTDSRPELLTLNNHGANAPGGLLITNSVTGNLPAPGAVITKGNYLTALDSTSIAAIPAVSGVTYTYTLTGDETITFGTPTAGYSPTFELWLTMPTTVVTFSFGTTIIWSNNGRFASYNPAPDFTEGGLVYRLVFQYDGTSWLGNLVSVKEV